MPSSLVVDDPSSPPTPPHNRKKRKRKREDDEGSMSPEEETSASPPAGLIAGREEEERRVSSPPSGSKFLHDQSPLHHESTTVLDNEKEEKPTSRTEDSWGTSDVEKFDGKIVYNPDGSAYIIEDSEMSEDDAADLPRMIGDGCIVDGRGVNLPSQYQVFPQIANAFYVSRNASIYSALYNSSSSSTFPNKMVQDKKCVPEVPIMHSYRVYSVRDNKTGENQDKSEEEKKGKDCSSVPVKPILMCFICKLSFGYAKSFVAHAMGDHNVTLQDNEKDILALKNMSAIIQCVGKEKEPLVSFLEPVGATAAPSTDRSANRISPSAHSFPKDSDGIGSSECGEDVSCTPESLVIHGRQSSSPSNAATVQTFHVPETSVSLPLNGSSSNSSINYTSSNSIRNSNNNMSSINCVMDLTRKSPISNSGNNGRNSLSPGASPNSSPMMTPNSLQYPQHPPNFLTGTTIGVCPDHMGGRPSGVECAKCEMILSSSRMSTAGPLAGMHSRNSCKTLKCPKCNWHYKYQETLEIHMKEKHPETETSCMFCIAGQPHPRLARGETYTCGYKPYRCEVCNYSTTTKGNLSIHMQSDKHLNNMQELQNGGVPNNEITHQTPPPPSHTHKPGMSSPVSTSSHQHLSPINTQSQKPKPTFRCDVCNYETNVARNLRIHMTSEKHTHNIMVLQQNVKHMQTISAMQQSHQQQLNLEQLLHFHSGLQIPNDKPPQHAEAALADMAYNQALLIQMMTGGQLPPHIPPELAPHMDMGLNPETMEPPPEPADPNPDHLFQCCVCSIFQTDSLEQLSHHISQDRTKIREQEILSVVAGNYICNLCTYKTNLKANFMLHCKTDKHLQKLQHVNHVKEGGIRNEWKLKYVSAPGGVQVRCHACDYYTNSAHKLQLHVAAQRHEASSLLFRHLREIANESDFPNKMFHCVLCGFSSKAKLALLQHVRTVKHLQMEQIHQLQKRSEGKDLQTDINEVFQIINSTDGDSENEQDRKDEDMMEDDEPPQKQRLMSQQYEDHSEQKEEQDLRTHLSDESKHMCPFCNFVSNSEMRIQAHIVTQHSQQRRERSQSPPQRTPSPQPRQDFLCPLCQDGFSSKMSLEKHVMQIHSVNSEGLQRLLMLVDQSHWLNTTSRPSNTTQQSSSESSSASKHEKSMEIDERDDDSFELDESRCQTCLRYFKSLDELCQHQTESGHIDIKQTPTGPNYLCWKKGCNQYFPSASSLQVHFREIHSSNNNTISEKHVYKYRCNQCSLAFKTLEKLEQHSQYHMIRDATKCIFCSRNFRTIQSLHKHVESAHSDLSEEEMAIYKQSLLSNPLLLAGISGQLMNSEKMDITTSDVEEDKGEDENSDDGSVQYKEQQFFEDYLNSQSIAEDNYNDPNRKYKCHRCKVAFTRQNYLTSHNKTLLHRKGEKLSYPMEKYLDPNRPYKCDVCKESFTQKNILLVHYNSVSHLHKLKRSIQEQHNNNNTSPQSTAAALAASLGVTSPQNLLMTPKSNAVIEDDDKKPFKCNICKVAYSQGSTLDIHMRSVLHQTRASKLQDLAMSGQIDLSKPLIEQPEQSKIQDQHKKMIQDILTGSGGVQKSQNSPVSNQSNSISNASPTSQLSCQRCNALFISQEQLTTHQQLYCLFGSPMNMFPPLSASTMTTQQSLSSPKSPPLSTTPLSSANSEELTKSLFQSNNKKSSHMYKHLLESFGFDLVMQFNENHQRRQKRESTEKMLAELQQVSQEQSEEPMDIQDIKLEQKDEDEVEKEDDLSKSEESKPEESEVREDETNLEIKKEKEDEEEGENNEENPESLPEVSKSICSNCNKEFSSIWVLKAHYEEVHKDLVPLDFLEKYAQHIKVEIDKKGVPPTSNSPTSNSPNSSNPSVNTSTNTTSTSTEQTPEKDENDEPQAKIQKTHVERPRTAPSTPAASTTPASTTSESLQPNLSSLAAAMGISASSAANIPMSLAQQMNEMQAALNVMAASQLQQQLQFNPMMMGMAGLGMGLPLGLNMPALAAMNLQPPLVPMMMPPPFDSMTMQQAAAAQQPMFSPQSGPNSEQQPTLSKQQMMHQQQAAQAAANQVAASQQKRARTRITDDQLKILRAHFDINNSPSEDAINEMASQSGLPPKVIKHWFRNTLFKERQRNKDSPYNFNNPPSTSLNLEEYEKTGEAKVTKLNNATEETSHSQALHQVTQIAQAHGSSKQSSLNDNIKPAVPVSFDKRKQPTPSPSQPSNPTHQQIIAQQHQKQMEFEQLHLKQQEFQRKQILEYQQQLLQRQQQERQENQQMQQQPFLASPSQPFQGKHVQEVNVKQEIKQEMDSSMAENDNMKYYDTDHQKDMNDKSYPHDIEMSPPSSHMNTERMNLIQMRHSSSPENLSLNLTSIISSQLGQDSQSSQNNPMLPPKLTPPNFTSPNHPGMPLTPTRSVSPGRLSNSSDCYNQQGGNSNGSNSSGGSSGKRANRTRFTDYQIKVLQEFFENNAYPKDDDLEYLSKLLNLSPRVIVVWFQNARQKARKVYENQPPAEPIQQGNPSNSPDENNAGRFQRTPGLNYQCKKCLLVFQRYYELIRHQKTHCFKEEDAKRSAQAQAAAAQIAAVLSSEDSNSSTIVDNQQRSVDQMSVMSSNPPTPAPLTPTPSTIYPQSPRPPTTPTPEKETTFQCDHCNLVFNRFDLWREHQIVHIMNPNLFPNYPPDSPFGILQQHAQIQQQQQQLQQTQQNQTLPSPQNNDELNSSNPSSPHPLLTMLQQNNKRKLEEFDYFSDSNCGDIPKDKRLRTTILPEQLDYLYQKYQVESNPSRKMLETIAKEVNLKKRVVQVWFQNTRARERKGQFRAHSQVINKRCPFCPALFKVKSAFESHLSTKHAEQCSKNEINIDAIPDEELSLDSAPSIASSNEASFKNFNSNMPPVFNNMNDMDSLKKYYEESMKRYLSEIQLNGTKDLTPEIIAKLKSETNPPRETTTTPLDLSKPFDGMGGFNEFEEEDEDDSLSECSDDENSPNSPKNQINNVQLKILSCLYESHKNPNMNEIEALSKEMNINKKLVQIWYENTRIKDGKNNVNAIINECNICNVKYNNKYKIQDHIFTKKHIDNLKVFLQKSPNTQILPEIINNNNNNNQQEIAQLQLLQMASNLGISPQSLAIAVSKLDSKDQSAMTNEDLTIVQQLYGLTSNSINSANQQQLLSSNDKNKTKASKHTAESTSSSSQQSQGIHISSYGFAENILKQIENLCYEATQVKDNNQSIITINEQLIDKYIISKIICIGTICKNCKYMFHNNYNIYKHMLDCRANSSSNLNDNKSVGIIKILKYNYYCMICKYYYFNNLNEFYLHFNNVHKNMVLNNNNDEDKNDKNKSETSEKQGDDVGIDITNSNDTNSKISKSSNISNETGHSVSKKESKEEVARKEKVDKDVERDFLNGKAIENEVNEIVGKITTIAANEIAQR